MGGGYILPGYIQNKFLQLSLFVDRFQNSWTGSRTIIWYDIDRIVNYCNKMIRYRLSVVRTSGTINETPSSRSLIISGSE